MKINDDIYIKQGDCLELMKEIEDKSIDMILCDLPLEEIINLYCDEKYTLRAIAKKFNTNHHKIKNILLKNNIKIDNKNRKKRTMRARLEENEEAIMGKRNDLICEIKKRMGTSTELTELFTIEWEVI